MHAAKIERSPRLQRVLQILSDGREHSTREIVMNAEVMAVNACVAELRHNGCTITCRQTRSPVTGRPVFRYRLVDRGGN